MGGVFLDPSFIPACKVVKRADSTWRGWGRTDLLQEETSVSTKHEHFSSAN